MALLRIRTDRDFERRLLSLRLRVDLPGHAGDAGTTGGAGAVEGDGVQLRVGVASGAVQKKPFAFDNIRRVLQMAVDSPTVALVSVAAVAAGAGLGARVGAWGGPGAVDAPAASFSSSATALEPHHPAVNPPAVMSAT